MCRYWDVPPLGFEHITPMQYKAMQGRASVSACVHAAPVRWTTSVLSLALSGRADTNHRAPGHDGDHWRGGGAHTGPRGGQSDDAAGPAALRGEHPLWTDRGEPRLPGVLLAQACSAVRLLRSPWRSSSTPRCGWRDWLKLPVIPSWLCRSTRTRTSLSWRSVLAFPPLLFQPHWSPADVCVSVPLRGRDHAGHGLRRHHLPGSVSEDQTASRLPTSARNLGAAGVPRPRFISEPHHVTPPVFPTAVKRFLSARISRRGLHRGPGLASQAVYRRAAQLPERRPGIQPPGALSAPPPLAFSLFERIRPAKRDVSVGSKPKC